MRVASHLPIASKRRQRERGSALLIVFVFAAIVAIMLYREMPVTVFEAQRQKEQLLVDRGHQYVRAVQLFYRRNRGQYPSSFEQLESTNNIRYLRRRYKDPFTGKNDWRLIHAGPGGMPIDSKLPAQVLAGLSGLPGATGQQTGSLGQSSSTSSFSSQGINTAASLAESSSSSSDGTVVQQAPQRPPAIPANGAGGTGQTPSSDALNQNPDAPLLPPSSNDGSPSGSGPGGVNAGGAGNRNAGANGNGSATQGPGIMQTLSPVLGAGTTPAGSSGFGSSQSGSGSSLGQLSGGGALAGVASKAKGRTIKLVNEQVDYSLWEFFYNPATDLTGRTSLNSSVPPTGQTGAPGVAIPSNNTNSSFSSGFGSSNSSNSSSSSNATDSTGTANAPVTLPPSTAPNQTPPQ